MKFVIYDLKTLWDKITQNYRVFGFLLCINSLLVIFLVDKSKKLNTRELLVLLYAQPVVAVVAIFLILNVLVIHSKSGGNVSNFNGRFRCAFTFLFHKA